MMMMMSMETSFLTSNSIMKPLPRRPTMAKYKLIFPNVITCCDGKSSSLEDNNNRPSIDADWRSFRARLVANEHTTTTRPKQPLSNRWNPQPINDPHPRATKATTWAHVLGKPEQGCLLIATEKLDGVNIFRSTVTVILVLSMDSAGATGIILNRPSSLRSAVPDGEDILLDRRLYFGGPLNKKMVLVSTKRCDDYQEVVKRSGVFEEVMEGLYYGSEEESVSCAAEMVKRNEIGVEDVRVFEGYCWWGKAKLKEEIRDGYWKVIACSPNIFNLD